MPRRVWIKLFYFRVKNTDYYEERTDMKMLFELIKVIACVLVFVMLCGLERVNNYR